MGSGILDALNRNPEWYSDARKRDVILAIVRQLGAGAVGPPGPSFQTFNIAPASPGVQVVTPIPVGHAVQSVGFEVTTPFDGSPTLSLGTAGNPAYFLGPSDIALGVAAMYLAQIAFLAVGSPEQLIATFSPGGSTVGAGFITFQKS